MMPSAMYKLVVEYVCPTESICSIFADAGACNKALESAGCLLSKTCVVAKECIATASKLVQLDEFGALSKNSDVLVGPERVVSVINYMSFSEQLSSTAQSFADALPEVTAEFYKANAGAVHVLAGVALGYIVGYAYCRLQQPNPK